MDDMWSIEAWDGIKLFFPDNENGSRIIITTRLLNLVSQLADSYCLHMKFLDVDESWNLFCKVVFGEEGCPPELEEIGKKIAKGCNGLPLSISVIGGLLGKSKCDGEYWEYIAENLNSVVNLEDNERWLKILNVSYNQLPVYLKPCFLFVGVFPEDHKICVSMLIGLWVAQGFLKPISGKSSEEVAQEYLKGLISRNLILVDELGSTGNIKYCNIHDLLRDFCLRQAQKERFYNVMKQHSLNVHRRIVLPKMPLLPGKEFHDAVQSMQLVRSSWRWKSPPSLNFRLLRIWKRIDVNFFSRQSSNSLENMFHLVNLRYLAVTAGGISNLSSSIFCFWNLHTLIVDHWGIIIAPSEIWMMPQLRCVKIRALELQDPPSGDQMEGKNIVLRNLHTLSEIRNFKCSAQIIERIPNIKKLRTNYINCEDVSQYFFSNLDCLHKLESFHGSFRPTLPGLLQDNAFPQSLKKLTIRYFHSKDHILDKIGSLPFLEKLSLIQGSFQEHEWETVEIQFCSLKFLLIDTCSNLEFWKTESTHFPRLERLVLYNLHKLKEVPSEIGEIPTLQSIHLNYCSVSAVESAKRILDEQVELGNEDLQVFWMDNRLKNMESHNFQVECSDELMYHD